MTAGRGLFGSNNNMPILLFGDFNEGFLKDNCKLSFSQSMSICGVTTFNNAKLVITSLYRLAYN